MHLLELAEVIGAEVEVSYFHPKRRFTASLKGATVESAEPTQGVGPSAEAAQRNYAKLIAGKRLVHAQREFAVPKNLSF